MVPGPESGSEPEDGASNDTFLLVWKDEFLVRTETVEHESMLPRISDVIQSGDTGHGNFSEKK